MFSNPTSSELRLSSTATMSDEMLSASTPPLHCASILQPATPSQIVTFESISAQICLNRVSSWFRFTLAKSWKPDLWTWVFCVYLVLFYLCFSDTKKFSFESLFAIWSLSPQRFHYYLYLGIVSWQYRKDWTVLILMLCLLRVSPLVCLSFQALPRLYLSLAAGDKGIGSYLHIHLFSEVLPVEKTKVL